MNFTSEEIKLCKKIAEKHRKEVKYGDWVYHEPCKNYFLVIESMGFHYKLQMGKRFDGQDNRDKKINFPLFQISDCLKFLSEKEVMWELSIEVDYTYWLLAEGNKIDIRAKTPLEACLKAVLAIVEKS